MISRDDVAALRPEEKDAILDAMVGMAWTDGEIQPEELVLLRKTAGQFTDESVEKLLEGYKVDLERVGRKIASSDLGPVGRRVLVESMAIMAAASGNVTEAERSFYRQCLQAFGMNEPQRQRLEGQVRERIYREWLRDRIGAAPEGKLGDDARKELDEKRKVLELDEAAASRLEEEVRRDLARKG